MITTAKTSQHNNVLLAGRIALVVGFGLLLVLVLWRLLSGDFLNELTNEYAVELSLASVTAFVSSDTFFLYLTILRHSVLILFWLVAAFIFWRRPQDWIALLVSSVLLIVPITLTLGGGDAAWQTLLTFLSLALFFLLLFVFPDGRFVPLTDRGRLLLGLAILFTPFLSFAILAIFLPRYTAEEQAYGAFLATIGAIMLAGVISQLYRYQYVADATQRQQTRWILFGLSFQLVWILWWILFITDLFDVLGLSDSGQALIGLHINILVPLLIPVTFGVAMLRDGFWNSDPFINRALVYGTLSAIIVILYILIVGTLGLFFQTRGGLLTALVATGVVAILFQPLRSWLQQSVNRLMYGDRDDPVGVLTRLASQMETAETTDRLLFDMVADIATTLKLPHVSIWLPDEEGKGWQMAASAGSEQPPDVETIAIRYKNQEIGRLVVSSRSPREPLSPGDKQLLGNIAQLVATTVRALQLNEQLQQSRKELVTAREEERRRIRRDLHDGLGPVMASITLQADTAVDLVRSDPDETVVLLQKIVTKAQKGVFDIRHLVYGLRPPALDELGLEGAIRQFISSLGADNLSITLKTSGDVSVLPAAAEVATYRIVQEAINNVISHAQSTFCHIHLTVGGELRLEITDNGRGLPENRPVGIGLRSMRDRAAELGGICLIDTVESGGTQVIARIPLNTPK